MKSFDVMSTLLESVSSLVLKNKYKENFKIEDKIHKIFKEFSEQKTEDLLEKYSKKYSEYL